MPTASIDLRNNYLLLDSDGSAVVLPGGADFWRQLMSGDASDPGIRRLMDSQAGRLLSWLSLDTDWTQWEMHPTGDEILILLEGHATFFFDRGAHVEEIDHRAGRVLVVPKGVWHTASVVEPGMLLAITVGAGTDHRPR